MAEEHDEPVWLHSQASLSITELAQFSGLPEEELRELVDLGALSPLEGGAMEWHFRASWVGTVRAAARVRADLELETPALALVLAFLARIDQLEARVRELDAQLVRPRN
jgi:chaperone modulatory protein CbpM